MNKRMVERTAVVIVLILAICVFGYVVINKKANSGLGTNVHEFSDSSLKLSFKYPSGWKSQYCSSTSIIFLPNSSTTVTCNGFPYMGVQIQDGDKRSQLKLPSQIYKNISNQPVTVSGVTGTKETGNIGNTKGTSAESGKAVTFYVFYTNNKSYSFYYFEQDRKPDTLAVLNKIVNTIQFK